MHAKTKKQIKRATTLAALNSKKGKKRKFRETLSAVIISPLCDVMLYPLYSQEAVSAATDEERLVKIHNVIQQLPPPHYRSRLKLSVAPWWLEVELFDFRKRKCCTSNCQDFPFLLSERNVFFKITL